MALGNSPSRRARFGYTMVEMLVAVAILGIISSIGARIMIQSVRYFRFQRARIEIQRDARTALDLINRTMREATGSTVVVDQAAGQPPFSRVSFTTVSGRTMIFYQQNQSLMKSDGGKVSKICDNIQYIAFNYPMSSNSGILSVAITLQESTYESRVKALQLSVQKVRIMN